MRSRPGNKKRRSFEHLRIVFADIDAGGGMVPTDVRGPVIVPRIAAAEAPPPDNGSSFYRYGPAAAVVRTFPRRRILAATAAPLPAQLEGYYIPSNLPVPQVLGPPAPPAAGMFWFRDSSGNNWYADVLETMPVTSDGANVASWQDQWASALVDAGNALAAGATNPKLKLAAVNGRNSLVFAGTDQHMTHVSGNDQNSMCALYAIAPAGFATGGGIMLLTDSSLIQFDLPSAYFTLREKVAADGTKTLISPDMLTSATTHVLYGQVQNSQAMRIWQDGTLEGTTALANDPLQSGGCNCFLGTGFDTLEGGGVLNEYFNGYICEAIGYSGSLQIGDIQAVARYLRAKWVDSFQPSGLTGYTADWNAAYSVLWQNNGRSVHSFGLNDAVGNIDDGSGHGHHLGTDDTHTGTRRDYEAIGNYLTSIRGNAQSYHATFTLTQPCHIFVVTNIAFGQSGGATLLDGSTADVKVSLSSDGQHLTVAAGSTLTSTMPCYPGTTRQFSFFFSSTSSKCWVDGQLFADNNAGMNNPGGITLGSDRAGANFIDMQWCQVLVFNQEITGTDFTDLSQYLSNYWNVPYIAS